MLCLAGGLRWWEDGGKRPPLSDSADMSPEVFVGRQTISSVGAASMVDPRRRALLPLSSSGAIVSFELGRQLN